MFSPDELDAIHAQALRQWQQEQRRVLGYRSEMMTGAEWLASLQADLVWSADDVRYLKALHISPA